MDNVNDMILFSANFMLEYPKKTITIQELNKIAQKKGYFIRRIISLGVCAATTHPHYTIDGLFAQTHF